jgi:hypothetical protein
MKEARKVQGNQWYVTLPLSWRQGHDVRKGDVLEAHYNMNSVLIFAHGVQRKCELCKHLLQTVNSETVTEEGVERELIELSCSRNKSIKEGIVDCVDFDPVRVLTGRELTPLELKLIDLLINLPSWEDSLQAVDALRDIVKQFEA